MLGKKSTKPKKMKIKVYFNYLGCLGEFQKKLNQRLNFYIVEDYNACSEFITFVIIDYEYPMFMEAFNETIGITIISIK